MKKTGIILTAAFAVSAFACSVDAGESPAETTRAIAGKVLADHAHARAAKNRLDDAGVKLGAWYRIGPFRDQGPLLNWMDNVDSKL